MKKQLTGFLREKKYGIIIGSAFVLLICAAAIFVTVSGDSAASHSSDTAAVSPSPGNGVEDSILFWAEYESGGRVDVQSGFYIRSSDKTVGIDYLRSNLAVNPAVPFKLSAEKDAVYLKPEALLESDTVYSFTLQYTGGSNSASTLSWAFQTESDFRIVSTLPGSGSTYVALNTGIELGFSGLIGDIEDYFEISPETEGRFEYHNKTAVFVPSGELKPGTLYTVTVRAGCPGLSSDDRLAEDYVFSFRTVNESSNGGVNPSLYLANGMTEAFLTDDPVVVELYTGYKTDLTNTEFTVNVYSLEGQDKYLELAAEHEMGVAKSIGYSSDYILDTSALSLQSTFTSGFMGLGENSYRKFIVLPENPGAGYYLIDIKTSRHGGLRVQKLVCVSDITVYIQSLDDSHMLWVNDAASGRPLVGAAVSVSGEPGETDERGIAHVSLPVEGGVTYPIEIESDGRTYADKITLGSSFDVPLSERFYSYIYCDRAAYLPTDKVRFWGFIAPRNAGEGLPDGLTVSLPGLPSVEVTPDSHGIFSGEFTLEGQKQTYYTELALCRGDEIITLRYIHIEDYEKPSYVLELELDRKYYHNGDTITAAANASFFDGTPAAGVKLSANTYGENAQENTDRQGNAEIRLKPPSNLYWNGYTPSWQPGRWDVYLSAIGEESGRSETSEAYCYFISDYMLLTDISLSDGGFTFSADTNEIDFSKVDKLFADGEEGRIYNEYELIRGNPYNQKISASVIKQEYVATETGEYYDFIRKQTAKTYSYDRVETEVASFDFTTEGGQYKSELLPYSGGERVSYRLVLKYTDPNGVRLESTVYISDEQYPRYSTKNNYALKTEKNTFELGDSLSVSLQSNLEPAPNRGTILYTVYQNEVISLGLSTQDTISIDCDESMLPNFYLAGAYFDGRHVYSLHSYNYDYYAYYDIASSPIKYDPAQRGLTVELTPDKDSYVPGEATSVNVKVTDADGRPVRADFILSVVDEAAFAVYDQTVAFLAEVYNSIERDFPNRMATFCSYIEYGINADGGGGGGGDGNGVRKDFVDTAAFIRGETGSDGAATVSFSLPDNLTSWRLTCLALTDEISAGHTTENVAVSIPFFINHVINKRYAVGDDVTLSARGAGTAIEMDDIVRYKAVLSGNGVEHKFEAEQPAYDYAWLSFGKLEPGEYSVTLSAESGDLSDTVVLPFTVQESLHELPVSRDITLDELGDITSLKYPVTLKIYDRDNLLYFKALSRLASADGQRSDEKLARAISREKYLLLNPEARNYLPDNDLSQIQMDSGAIKLLPYSEGEAELTARALAGLNGSALIDTDSAVSYLSEVLYNTKSSADEISSAYMGLAAAGQPVLSDISELLGSGDFDYEQQLRLAYGLALLGDFDTAGRWYDENISRKLIKTGNQLRLDNMANKDENYRVTSMAAAFACTLGHSDTKGLLSYVLENSSGKYLPLLDLMRFIQSAPLPSGDSSVISYTMNGERLTIDLAKTPVHFVRMGREQLESAGFESLSGNIGVNVSFTGGTDSLSGLPDSGININKRYEFTEREGMSLVKVTINVSFKDGLPADPFILSDVLPSGLRFVSLAPRSNSMTNRWYLLKEDAGKLDFQLERITREYKSNNTYTDKINSSFTVEYYARVATKGSYVADSAIVRHSRSDIFAVTPRTTLVIE